MQGPARLWEKLLLSLEVADSEAGIEGEEITPLAMENVPAPWTSKDEGVDRWMQTSARIRGTSVLKIFSLFYHGILLRRVNGIWINVAAFANK